MEVCEDCGGDGDESENGKDVNSSLVLIVVTVVMIGRCCGVKW